MEKINKSYNFIESDNELCLKFQLENKQAQIFIFWKIWNAGTYMFSNKGKDISPQLRVCSDSWWIIAYLNDFFEYLGNEKTKNIKPKEFILEIEKMGFKRNK